MLLFDSRREHGRGWEHMWRSKCTVSYRFCPACGVRVASPCSTVHGFTFTFKEARADEGDGISSPHPEYHGTVDRGTHRLERDEWKGLAGGTVDMHGNLSRLNLKRVGRG